MAKVVVPVATGFEEIEAVCIIDVLRRGGVEVLIASVGKELSVKGANGIVIGCDLHVSGVSAEMIDMIVLPGGWGGTNMLAQDVNVQSLLRAMDAKGKLIGAICAAPYALYKAGVLKQAYTCYPSVEEQIEGSAYLGESSAVVESGNVITSRGPATAICFALAIVRKLCGEESYLAVKGGLLADYCG